jgi:dimethylamine/trimethylamine dehydrogenase
LHRRGIPIATRVNIARHVNGTLELADIFTDTRTMINAVSLVIVGARRPRTALHDALQARQIEWREVGVRSVDRIGDALAPGAIVHAVHSGHLYARTLDAPEAALPYKIDHGLAELAAPHKTGALHE